MFPSLSFLEYSTFILAFSSPNLISSFSRVVLKDFPKPLIKIASNIYTPKNYSKDKRYPDIVIAVPNGAVKEQAA